MEATVRKPAEIYRDMLTKEMSVFRPVIDPGEIVQCLRTYGEEALNYEKYSYWTDEERAARLIWSGLGFFIFGCMDCLDPILAIIAAFPAASEYKVCRYYVPAIDRLLPLPDHLSVQKDPQAVRAWVRSHSSELSWDEDAGKVVVTKSPETSKTLGVVRDPKEDTNCEETGGSSASVRWLFPRVCDVERQALVGGWKPHLHSGRD